MNRVAVFRQYEFIELDEESVTKFGIVRQSGRHCLPLDLIYIYFLQSESLNFYQKKEELEKRSSGLLIAAFKKSQFDYSTSIQGGLARLRCVTVAYIIFTLTKSAQLLNAV